MSASGGSPAQAVGKPPKISERAFRVAIGVLLGLAVVSAVGRTFARFYKFHRILLDDAFFYLAVVTLIAGTGLTYADVPFIYLQEYVEAGLLKPPPDLVPRLIHSEKIQDAATVLLVCTVFSIKFSFLFFFKLLIRQQKKLMIWWWTVLVLLVPIAAVVMVSDFIACSYFDDRIFVKCVSPGALARQNGIFKASGILDIITDTMLISIPVALLWNVQISLRRKLALGGILCLSIFMIIIAIIRIAAGNIANDQVDAAWAVFWLQVEACVGVMVVSVSAFRALFVAHKASKYNNHSPGHTRTQTASSDMSSKVKSMLNKRLKASSLDSDAGSQDGWRDKKLPATPSPVHIGVSTHIRQSPIGGRSFDEDRVHAAMEELELPLQGHKIAVRQDIESNQSAFYHDIEAAKKRPSTASFV